MPETNSLAQLIQLLSSGAGGSGPTPVGPAAPASPTASGAGQEQLLALLGRLFSGQPGAPGAAGVGPPQLPDFSQAFKRPSNIPQGTPPPRIPSFADVGGTAQLPPAGYRPGFSPEHNFFPDQSQFLGPPDPPPVDPAAGPGPLDLNTLRRQELFLLQNSPGGDGGGDGGGGGGGDGGGSGCFVAGTQVAMADGTTKPVEAVRIGDETRGGRVTATMIFAAPSRMFDYRGIVVSGSHAVFENGKWKRVADSDDARPHQGDVDLVYVFDTTSHRIYISGVMFADYSEVDGDSQTFEAVDGLLLGSLQADELSKQAA